MYTHTHTHTHIYIYIYIAKEYSNLLSFPQNKAINEKSNNLVRSMLVTEPSYTIERMEAIGTGTVPPYFKVPNNGYKPSVVCLFILHILYLYTIYCLGERRQYI